MSLEVAYDNLLAQLKAVQAECDELLAELLRVKEICLREVGIGIVNEVVIAATRKEQHHG